MISPRIVTLAFVLVACVAGAVALSARGQSTARPGDPTQGRVWVENRSPNEAIPVVVERTVDARVHLATAGLEGWEAVGVLTADSASTTVLLKRPR